MLSNVKNLFTHRRLNSVIIIIESKILRAVK